MKLYHGTSEKAAKAALSGGLRPRRDTKRSNWAATSHPGAVYLTSAYGPFFGANALNVGELRRAAPDAPNARFAVIEVDVERLNPFDLVPDEDALEQIGRGHDELPEAWNMKRRTRHYRDRLKEYANGEAWRVSLRAMGTCAHLGVIPSRAMTRVAFVDIVRQRTATFAALDAQVSVSAFRFAGSRHVNLTRHVFGDPLPADLIDFDREFFERAGRDGIEVVDLQREDISQ